MQWAASRIRPIRREVVRQVSQKIVGSQMSGSEIAQKKPATFAVLASKSNNATRVMRYMVTRLRINWATIIATAEAGE